MTTTINGINGHSVPTQVPQQSTSIMSVIGGFGRMFVDGVKAVVGTVMSAMEYVGTAIKAVWFVADVACAKVGIRLVPVALWTATAALAVTTIALFVTGIPAWLAGGIFVALATMLFCDIDDFLNTHNREEATAEAYARFAVTVCAGTCILAVTGSLLAGMLCAGLLYKIIGSECGRYSIEQRWGCAAQQQAV